MNNRTHRQARTNDETRRTRERIQRLSQQLERLAIQLNALVVADQQEQAQTEQARNERVEPNRSARARRTSAATEEQETAPRQADHVHRQEQERPPALTNPYQQRELIVGDRIVILNNYQGLRGARGIVTYTTATQVSVRLDGETRIRVKNRSSVGRI